VAISLFVVSSSGGTCLNPTRSSTNYATTRQHGVEPHAERSDLTAAISTPWVWTCRIPRPKAPSSPWVPRSPPDSMREVTTTSAGRTFRVRLVAANRVIGVLNEGISATARRARSAIRARTCCANHVKWVIFSDNRSTTSVGRRRGRHRPDKNDDQHGPRQGGQVPVLDADAVHPVEPKRTTVINFIKSADSGCD